MTYALIITGSRALASTPQARAWARDILSDAIGGHPHRSELQIIHGGAVGPDSWADARAAMIGIPRVVYYTTGVRRWIWPDGDTHATDWRDRSFPLDPRRAPLVRNEAMIRETWKRFARELDHVQCLALRAPWARTSGTAHTIGLAKRNRFEVISHLCPAEFGPAHLQR